MIWDVSAEPLTPSPWLWGPGIRRHGGFDQGYTLCHWSDAQAKSLRPECWDFWEPAATAKATWMLVTVTTWISKKWTFRTKQTLGSPPRMLLRPPMQTAITVWRQQVGPWDLKTLLVLMHFGGVFLESKNAMVWTTVGESVACAGSLQRQSSRWCQWHPKLRNCWLEFCEPLPQSWHQHLAHRI